MLIKEVTHNLTAPRSLLLTFQNISVQALFYVYLFPYVTVSVCLGMCGDANSIPSKIQADNINMGNERMMRLMLNWRIYTKPKDTQSFKNVLPNVTVCRWDLA